MSQIENRGRRRTYEYEDRQRIADVIRQHGIRGAREVLSRQICHQTLRTIAGEFGIVLQRGRRRRQAA
jgi:hypothetical protein